MRNTIGYETKLFHQHLLWDGRPVTIDISYNFSQIYFLLYQEINIAVTKIYKIMIIWEFKPGQCSVINGYPFRDYKQNCTILINKVNYNIRATSESRISEWVSLYICYCYNPANYGIIMYFLLIFVEFLDISPKPKIQS